MAEPTRDLALRAGLVTSAPVTLPDHAHLADVPAGAIRKPRSGKLRSRHAPLGKSHRGQNSAARKYAQEALSLSLSLSLIRDGGNRGTYFNAHGWSGDPPHQRYFNRPEAVGTFTVTGRRRSIREPAGARIIAPPRHQGHGVLPLGAVTAGLTPAAAWICGRPSGVWAAAFRTTAWAGSSQSIVV